MKSTVWGGRAPLLLIVDDQPGNLQLLAGVLGGAGFDVMPADSGAVALARLRAALPDLILLDLRMPEMDGFDVLAQLRGEPAWADLPVVVLTAAQEREVLVRAFAEGAVDYLTKPFVAEELVARVRTHVELKRARDQLRIAIKEREDLATIVVHDLKNPLFNISLNASMLRTDADEHSVAAQRARSIEASASRALEFVERYLDRRAGVELRRGYEPQLEQVDAMVAAAALEFTEQASARGLRIVTSTPGQLSVACDRASTLSILRNLLSNALKFSPDGGEIELGAAEFAAAIRFWVADRGPGISKKEKDQLFRRYVRLAAQPQSGPQSTGVGLALARQEAEWMGGELWHEARVGGGSVFILQLARAVDSSGD